MPAKKRTKKGATKSKYVRKWARFGTGFLRGWTKKLPDKTRLDLLKKMVKKESYATIVRRLNQLRNVTKDQETKKKATKDMAALKKIYRP